VFLFVPYAGCVLFMMAMFLVNFNKSFIVRDNLQNLENIKCKLGDSQKSTKLNVLYFNDIYVFIEKVIISCLDSTEYRDKIIIVKIDELFNEDYCVEFYKKKEDEALQRYNDSLDKTPLGKKIKEDSLKIENIIKRIDSLHILTEKEIEKRN